MTSLTAAETQAGADKAKAKVAELKAICESKAVGSQLSVLIDLLLEWLKTLNFGDYGPLGIHMLIQGFIEYGVPALKNLGGTTVGLVLDGIIVPLLKKWDESMYPTPAPTT